MKRLFSLLAAGYIMNAFSSSPIGSIERFDNAMDAIISKNAIVEILADSFKWSEGPVWLEKQQMLLFSDIPSNAIFQWSAAGGKQLYLKPSGYTGAVPRGGEMGSNALLLNNTGQLVLCQHGNRQMALMNSPINHPSSDFSTIAGAYQGKKLNSPNDAVYRSNGDLFFTDPPYGLEKNMEDPLKELPFQGVYRVTPQGEVHLLTDSITRPNGIAFMPGENTLLVGNSDGDKPLIYAYSLDANGQLSNPHIFCDGAALPVPEKGGFDGIKVDRQGNVFASGPGGICIFNSKGKMIGRIKIPGRTSNCAFADNEKTLFITADNYLLRIKMR